MRLSSLAQALEATLKRYEQELFRFVETRKPEVFKTILEKKQLDDDVKALVNKTLEEFAAQFTA